MPSLANNRAPAGKSMSSARLPVARLQPSKAAGRPSRSLAKAISWLASQRQPSISATPSPRRRSEVGWTPVVFHGSCGLSCSLCSQRCRWRVATPRIVTGVGNSASRKLSGWCLSSSFSRVPAGISMPPRRVGRSSTALCAASSRARSRSYCQRPISSQARSPNGISRSSISRPRLGQRRRKRWRARGLKARSDSQTSSQMPATNDDR